MANIGGRGEGKSGEGRVGIGAADGSSQRTLPQVLHMINVSTELQRNTSQQVDVLTPMVEQLEVRDQQRRQEKLSRRRLNKYFYSKRSWTSRPSSRRKPNPTTKQVKRIQKYSMTFFFRMKTVQL